MKAIKFTSQFQDHVSTEVFVGSAPCEKCSAKGGFHNGDIKQISDGDAAILLRNPQFSEVQTKTIDVKPADKGDEVSKNV